MQQEYQINQGHLTHYQGPDSSFHKLVLEFDEAAQDIERRHDAIRSSSVIEDHRQNQGTYLQNYTKELNKKEGMMTSSRSVTALAKNKPRQAKPATGTGEARRFKSPARLSQHATKTCSEKEDYLRQEDQRFYTQLRGCKQTMTPLIVRDGSNASPSRKVLVRFNQVSRESPFCPANDQDSSEQEYFDEVDITDINFAAGAQDNQGEPVRHSMPEPQRSDYEGLTGFQSVIKARGSSKKGRLEDRAMDRAQERVENPAGAAYPVAHVSNRAKYSNPLKGHHDIPTDAQTRLQQRLAAQEKAKEHLRNSPSPVRHRDGITDPVTGPIPDLYHRSKKLKSRSRSDPRARNGLGISENIAAGVPSLFGKEQDIQAYFPDAQLPQEVFAPQRAHVNFENKRPPPYARDEGEDPFTASPSKEGSTFNPRGYAGVPTYPERRAPFDPEIPMKKKAVQTSAYPERDYSEEDHFRGRALPHDDTQLNDSYNELNGQQDQKPQKSNIAWPSAAPKNAAPASKWAPSNYPSTQASWKNENKSPNLRFSTMPSGGVPHNHPTFGSRIPQKQAFMTDFAPHPTMGAIEEAIDDIPSKAKLDVAIKRGHPLKEPMYRNLSQNLLKDFNKRSIEDLKTNYGISSDRQIDPFTANQNYQEPFSLKNLEVNSLAAFPRSIRAAIVAQKFMKGYLVRRDPGLKALCRLYRMASKLSFGLPVQNLVRAMRLSHQRIKQQKQFILNTYITYCAVKIQKAFRGFLVRKYVFPVRKAMGMDALGRSNFEKLEAVALGWRIRRIMKLKETKNKARLVLDHDVISPDDPIDQTHLVESRNRAAIAFMKFIDKISQNGEWLMLKYGRDFYSPSHPKINRSFKESPARESYDRELFTSNDSSKRGGRSQPSQKYGSPGERRYVNIYASNKFEPNIHDDCYRQRAKEGFERRMNYNPRSRGPSQTTSNYYYDPKHYALSSSHGGYPQTAPKSLNQSLENNNWRIDKRQSAAQPARKGRHAPLDDEHRNPYLGGESKNSFKPRKQTMQEQRAQESLERRTQYIPDMRQRKQVAMANAAKETPEDFLDRYKQRKNLRTEKYDPVAQNAQLSVEEAILQRYYGQNMTGMAGGQSIQDLRGVSSDDIQPNPEATNYSKYHELKSQGGPHQNPYAQPLKNRNQEREKKKLERVLSGNEKSSDLTDSKELMESQLLSVHQKQQQLSQAKSNFLREGDGLGKAAKSPAEVQDDLINEMVNIEPASASGQPGNPSGKINSRKLGRNSDLPSGRTEGSRSSLKNPYLQMGVAESGRKPVQPSKTATKPVQELDEMAYTSVSGLPPPASVAEETKDRRYDSTMPPGSDSKLAQVEENKYSSNDPAQSQYPSVKDTATAYGTVSDVSLIPESRADERQLAMPTMADSVRQEISKRNQVPASQPAQNSSDDELGHPPETVPVYKQAIVASANSQSGLPQAQDSPKRTRHYEPAELQKRAAPTQTKQQPPSQDKSNKNDDINLVPLNEHALLEDRPSGERALLNPEEHPQPRKQNNKKYPPSPKDRSGSKPPSFGQDDGTKFRPEGKASPPEISDEVHAPSSNPSAPTSSGKPQFPRTQPSQAPTKTWSSPAEKISRANEEEIQPSSDHPQKPTMPNQSSSRLPALSNAPPSNELARPFENQFMNKYFQAKRSRPTNEEPKPALQSILKSNRGSKSSRPATDFDDSEVKEVQIFSQLPKSSRHKAADSQRQQLPKKGKSATKAVPSYALPTKSSNPDYSHVASKVVLSKSKKKKPTKAGMKKVNQSMSIDPSSGNPFTNSLFPMGAKQGMQTFKDSQMSTGISGAPSKTARTAKHTPTKVKKGMKTMAPAATARNLPNADGLLSRSLNPTGSMRKIPKKNLHNQTASSIPATDHMDSSLIKDGKATQASNKALAQESGSPPHAKRSSIGEQPHHKYCTCCSPIEYEPDASMKNSRSTWVVPTHSPTSMVEFARFYQNYNNNLSPAMAGQDAKTVRRADLLGKSFMPRSNQSGSPDSRGRSQRQTSSSPAGSKSRRDYVENKYGLVHCFVEPNPEARYAVPAKK